jgi:hypothetical protein
VSARLIPALLGERDGGHPRLPDEVFGCLPGT